MNREITELREYPYRVVVQLMVTFPDGSRALEPERSSAATKY